MMKTTIYVPEELKRSIAAEAARRGTSEAEVIREALRSAVGDTRVRPRGGVFRGREPIAERADELLAGFGE
ncbi:MAG: CopG family transcriptional regulator [Protaetiibacter sp.]